MFREKRMPSSKEPSSIYESNHRSFQVNTAARPGFQDAIDTLATFRKQRATGDKLADFVDHMQLLARITNAIALQYGIKTGSLHPEPVISELLRMGGVSLQDVIGTDFDDLKNAINKIKDISSQLVTNDEITKVENHVRTLAKMREPGKKFINMDSLPGKQDCVSLFGIIDQAKLDANQINNFERYFDRLSQPVMDISSLKSDEDETKANDDYDFTLISLKSTLNGVLRRSVEFSAVSAEVEKLRNINVDTSFLRLLVEEHRIRSSFQELSVSPNEETTAAQNFLKFQQLASSFKNSRTILERLKTLILARQNSLKTITAGFPSGWKDLGKLENDVQDNWMKEQAKANVDLSSALSNAVQQIQHLKDDLEVLDKDWDTKLTDNGEVSDVLSREIRIGDSSGVDFSKGATKFIACGKPKIETVTEQDWLKVSNAMDSFSIMKTLNSLKEFDDMKNNFQEWTKLLEEVGSIKNEDIKQKVPKIVKSLKNPSVKSAKALQQFRQMNLDMKVLKVFANGFEAKKTAIKTKKDKLDNYIKEVKQSKASALYSCLGNTADSEHFEVIIDDYHAIRDAQLSSKVDSVIKAVENLQASVEGLKKLQTAGQSIQNADEVTMAGLSSLSNSKDVSDKLGKAVQGLANIKKADESRSLLKPLLDNADIIKYNADIHYEKLSFDDYHILLLFFDLKNSLDQMYSKIDNMKLKLDTISDTVLSSNDVGFTNAAKVPDVTVDVEKLKNSLAALIAVLDPANTDKQVLTEAQAALTTLANLDLEFSNYNIAAGSTVLGPLNMFLQTFHPKPKTLSESNDPNQSLQGKPAGGKQLGGDEDGSEGVSGLLIVIIVMCILAVGAAGGAVYWFFYRKTKTDKTVASRVTSNLPDEDVFAAILEHNFTLLDRMEKCNISPCGYLTKLVTSMDNNMQQLQATGESHDSESRDGSMFCKEKTAVKVAGFDDDFIHANFMMFGDIMYILSQAPLRGKEPGMQSAKISTIEKHWAMIDQKKVAIVAQLCNFEEGYVDRCAKYYPEVKGETMTHGRYTITCVDLIDISNKFNVGRSDLDKMSLVRLEYINYQEKEAVKKIVDIFRFYGWSENGAPKDPVVGLEILRFLDSYKKNVLVHCSTGIGRTCSLVGIKKGMEMARPLNMKPGDRTGVFQIMGALRDCRTAAIHTPFQISYMLISITKGLMELQGKDYLKEYEELCFDHEIMNDPRKSTEYTVMASGKDGVLMFIDATRKDDYKKEREAYAEMKRQQLAKNAKNSDSSGGVSAKV